MGLSMNNEKFEISAETIKYSLLLNYVIAVAGLSILLYTTYDVLLSKNPTWLEQHIELFTDKNKSVKINDVLCDKNIIYWFSDGHVLTSEFEIYTLINYHGEQFAYLNVFA
jgi:hypothetical protein